MKSKTKKVLIVTPFAIIFILFFSFLAFASEEAFTNLIRTVILIVIVLVFFSKMNPPPKYSGEENQIILKTLYVHKLWLNKIKNEKFQSVHNTIFIDLVSIKNSISLPGVDDYLSLDKINNLELYLRNIEDLEFKIQVLQIRSNTNDLHLKNNHFDNKVLEQIGITELSLNRLLIDFERITERNNKFIFFRAKKTERSISYYQKRIETKLERMKNKKFKINSIYFSCINCNQIFNGSICPACESKLKVKIKR